MMLDPGRKTDPSNGLKYSDHTYQNLLDDVVVEYNKIDMNGDEVTTKPNELVINYGYNKIRMFNTDIHIFKTNPLIHDVDITLGVRGKLEQLSKITDIDKKVICKTNCGFFNTNGSSEHLGTYIDEGKFYKAPNPTFIDFIYYKDGHTEIKYIKDTKECAYLQPRTKWAIGTSYSLIINGEVKIIGADKFDHSKFDNPRTILGQCSDGSWLSVVTEGRSPTNSGLNAKEEAELMKTLGACNACNMDGGGSSEFILNNKIMNKPTDGRERSIGSAVQIYLK
jgi:exopolysaccharide biosynthesis protein